MVANLPQYWVPVFLQEGMKPFPGEALLAALRAVHFTSLCSQYGLDQELIAPALSHLALMSTPQQEVAPFVILRYQPEDGTPLVIYHWDAAEETGKSWLANARQAAGYQAVKHCLAHTRAILAVSLAPTQFEDLGLLLAYEVARWAAARGGGLVYGLDGCWYRLNRHQAFIPMTASDN